MFGANKTPFSFGASTNTFGGQATGFGTTGTQPSFGASTPFGSQTAQTNMFGATTPPTGSSLFGGATPAFGTATSQQGFSFGQPAASQSSGLFGANQPKTGGLFATPAAKPTTFGGFGTGSTTSNLFGASATNTGNKMFGATGTTSNLFGNTSAFGSTTAAAGTTVKFNPPVGNDTMLKNGISTSISTKHQCITAMKDYETKSLEELRVEDYMANRKGPQAGSATSSLFGGSQAQPASGFGTTTGFSFGATPAATKPSTFGGFGSGFGTTTSTAATSSLFGGTQQKPSLFGNTTTTTASSTGFGGFGSTGTSLFGNTAAKPAFGATTTGFNTATSTGFGGGTTGFGGFGTTPAAGTSLFGGNKSTLTLGTPATSASTGFAFGSTNTGGSSLFGGNKPVTGFGGFGTNSTTGFGTTGGTSLFQNKPTGFGTTTGFGGLGTGFGGLGQTTLGANTQTATAFTNPLGGLQANTQQTALGVTANNAAAQQAQIQHHLIALANSPYGDSPLFRNLTQDPSTREDLKPTNPAAQKAILNQASQYKVGGVIRTTPKIKAKPLNSLLANGKSQLFEGLDEDDSSFGGNDTFVPRKSVKKLVIKKSSPNSTSLSGSLLQSRTDEDLVAPSMTYPSISNTTPQRSQLDSVDTPEVILGSKSIGRAPLSDERPTLDDTISVLNAKNKKNLNSLESSPDAGDNISDRSESPVIPHPAGIVLRRPGYYTVPSMDELSEVVDANGDCFVDNFSIGREGYGSVFFPGETNVSNMNLDEIVHFRRKEITIYPDDTDKPEEGEGLNKKAEVTLDCVWPTDKSTRSPVKSVDRLKLMNYQDKIEQCTMRIGAKFIDYRPETGSWVFEVKHFSKYGLVDDSDDEGDNSEANLKKLKMLQQQQLNLQKQKIQLTNGHQPPTTIKQQIQGKQLAPPVEILQEPMTAMEDEDSDMEDIEREALPVLHSSGSGDDFQAMDEEPQTVPVSHRIAQSMSVDARSVQMMKASFFGSDDENEMDGVGLGGVRAVPQYPKLPKHPVAPASPAKPLDKSVLNRSLLGSLLKPQYVSPRTLVQERDSQPSPSFLDSRTRESSVSRTSMQPAPIEHPIIPSGMTRSDRPRKIVGSRMQKQVLEFSKSIMYDKQDMIMDAGLFMGRSFRVGWGPNWTLAHSGGPLYPQKKESQQEPRYSILPGYSKPVVRKTSTFSVVLEKVKVTSTGLLDQAEMGSCEQNLAIQFEQSESTVQDGCPVFAATPGVDALHAYADQAEKQLELTADPVPDSSLLKQQQLVWSLCVALWGQLTSGDAEQDDEDTYSYKQARREAVSLWLENSCQDTIKNEIQKAKLQGDNGNLASVFSLLSGRQVAEACSMAKRVGDHRLAMLLAQGVGNNLPRQMLKKQLTEWYEQKVDKYITPERLKIYSLLAGTLTWQGSNKYVNTCDKLDWKRAFALHLWYHCPPMSGVAEALHSYDEAFNLGSEMTSYAKSPYPPYMYKGSEHIDTEEDPSHVTRDTCYHLLTVYSKRSHRLERILAPTTSTPNQLDYSLSWHLTQVLQAIGYTHLSEYKLDSIHCNFAAQLESLGLWHWSAFVLLHIEDRKRRECCIRQLLERHISLECTEETAEKEAFLVDSLLIPKQWLHDAKALRSRYEGRKKDEAWHLLKAGHWNQSHQIVLRHIAPDCIINENYDYLKEFLSEMKAPSHCATIKDWGVGGALYWDYIAIIEQLDTLKQGEVDGYELEKLEPEVMSLCSRVGSLQCYDSKTRLCQSEMAKKTANLMRTLLMLQNHGSASGVSARILAPQLTQLPMPEDYALQELRQLTRSYMLEMTS